MTCVGLYFSNNLRVASISLIATRQREFPLRLGTWRERLDFRSPSLELAKIQVSPGFFPNREPSGSVLITCSMAFPTRPEPPVTRITSPVVMVVKRLRDCDCARWTCVDGDQE